MESIKVKRVSVAERFRKQMDLLTGDKKTNLRTLSSSAVNSTTTDQTNQKSDYVSIRLIFSRKY